jgi:DNA modification methylase
MEIEKIKNTVILGDCLTVLRQLKSNTIDLIITSPPYYKQREYCGMGIGNELTENEYLENIIAVFNECVRVTKNTGAIVFNIGDKYEDSGLRLIPYRFAIRIIDSKKAFLINNLTWGKLNPTPHQYRKKLVQSTEPFFIFAKTEEYVFNIDNFMSHLKNDGLKQKTNSGNGIGKSYFNLIDNSDLTLLEKEHAKMELQKTILDVRAGLIEGFRMKIRGIHAEPYGGQVGGRQAQLDKNGFTIIRINGEKLKRDIIESPVESVRNNRHPAIYPLFIVQELIKLLSNTGDIILDPFAGSGTTCIAARNQKRNFIGIEISPDYVNYANERLTTENQFINELFV